MTNMIDVRLDPNLTLGPLMAKRLGLQAAEDGSRFTPEARSVAAYPKRFTQHCSDHAKQSPWKGKLLLSLDGGGVRGYSSLLILKRLISLVAVLENGQQAMSYENRWYRFTPHTNSQDLQEGTILQDDVQRHIDGTITATFLSSSYRTHHYFDYVAGTSTGGLSAIMLSRLQMDIATALDQYQVFGDQVFANPSTFQVAGILRPKYKTSKVESAIKKVICNGLPEATEGGKSIKTRAANIQLANDNRHACHTAVVAKGGDYLDRPYIFRSYDHIDTSPLKKTLHHFNPGPAHQAKLWEVARATSAAPRYFDKMVIGHDDFIDGGVGTNNPADRVRQDVKQLLGDSPELIVSIGTGRPSEVDEGDGKKPMWMPKGLRRAKDFFNVVSKLAKIATQSEDTHNDLNDNLNALRRERGEDESKANGYPLYFRFNAPDISDIMLDEWRVSGGTNTTLDKLATKTENYLTRPEVKAKLQECAIELVRVRRERAGTERWEQFATNTTYKCPKSIDGDPVKHRTRDELRQHALIYHELVPWATFGTQHLCTLDNCATKPVPVQSPAEFLDHLKSNHGMHNPKLKEPSDLEDWLDSGKIPKPPSQQNGELTGMSRRPSGAREPPVRRADDGTGRLVRSTAGSQHQQALGLPTEQIAGAESSSESGGEAAIRNDGSTTTSQQQQHPQQGHPRTPISSVENNAGAGPPDRQTSDAVHHDIPNMTDALEEQAPRSSLDQIAGAEQSHSHNGNAILPVAAGQIGSSRPLVPGGLLRSLQHATEHLRRVRSE